jgi:hypothetical protein
MANTRLFYRSFAGGEISPEMYGRIDADRYQTGAATVRNMVPKAQGPVRSRPGFKLSAAVKNSANRTRLIPFTYSSEDTYVLEVGLGYIRFHQNGVLQNMTGVTVNAYKPTSGVSSTSIANDTVTTLTAHSFATGDPVRLLQLGAALPSPLVKGVTYYVFVVNSTEIALCETYVKALAGGTQSNRINLTNTGTGSWKIAYRYTPGDLVTQTGVTYQCKTPLPGTTSVDLSPPSLSAWYELPGDGTYEISGIAAFGFTADDLFDIHYVQSNDVLTLVHPKFAPVEVRRYAARKWAVEQIQFQPRVAAPTSVAATPRYGQRYDIDRWVPWDADINGRIVVQQLDLNGHQDFDKRLATGDIVYVENTKCSRLDGKRWSVSKVLATGGFWHVFFLDYQGTLPLRKGLRVTAWSTTVGAPLTITQPDHGFEIGARVTYQFTDYPNPLNGSTEYYVVNPTDTTYQLSTTDPAVSTTIVNRASGGGTDLFGFARLIGGTMQVLYQVSTLDNSYRVTAVYSDDVESAASDVVTVRNNIYSAGAHNTITWRYFVGTDATGAVREVPARFKVYKLDVGNYGLLGIVDRYSTETESVGIEGAGKLVLTWAGTAFKDNDPVSFSVIAGGSALPSPLVADQIYWIKRITTGANAGKFYLLDKPDGTEISGTTALTTVLGRRELFFRDDNIAVDGGKTIPLRDTEFFNANEYPRAVAYFEQRRVFAGTNVAPQNVWTTRSGTESDLSYHIPVLSDDRIAFQIAAREQSQIRHIVPMGSLLLLSASSEQRCGAVDGDALSPANISVRPQSYVGASNVQPAVVNNIVVFCAARGGHVREMGFSNDQQGYMTGDLSIRAAHLFDDYAILDLAYAKAPQPVVWCISSTGRLLGMTYIPEEKVTSWHWHDTDGLFESCAVVSEGTEDRLYVVVNRSGNRYVERLEPFDIDAVEDQVCLDNAKTVINAPASTTVSGLSHLNGKTVSILADGKIHPQRVVAGGSITLDYAAAKVHVGLPYTVQLKTLPAVMQVDGYGQGRTKNVNRAWIRMYESAGFKIGPSETALVPSQPPTTAQTLQSIEVPVLLSPSWQAAGQVVVQQDNPVPLTVIGMVLETSIGG